MISGSGWGYALQAMLAQPPGVRSCRNGLQDGQPGAVGSGGTWLDCTLLFGEHQTDLAACLEGLGEFERTYLIAELRILTMRAEAGALYFRPRKDDAGEVTQSHIRPRVLEIVMTKRRGEEGQQQTRIYFTEPAHEPGVLLHLLLAWKRPGPAGLEEQDGHMIQADRRLDHHYGETNL